MSTAKTTEERERLLELVETAMLRGAHRVVDILREVPDIKSRITAREYMDIIGERWAGRQSDNERERQRLIDEKREIIREAYTIISDSDKTLASVALFRPSGDEERTVQQQLDAQEVIANGAYANKTKAMRVILDAQSGIAKLLGLEVKKIEHSGSITEERNSTIAILTASAESHSIRGVLGSLVDPVEARHHSLSPEPAPVALPSGEGTDSELGSTTEVPPPQT